MSILCGANMCMPSVCRRHFCWQLSPCVSWSSTHTTCCPSGTGWASIAGGVLQKPEHTFVQSKKEVQTQR